MPSPFFSRYIIDWLATQTMTRAQQMVVEEVKSRVESGNLGSYEGVLFKESIRGDVPKDRITASGVDLGVVVATKQEVVGLLDKMGTPKVTKGNSLTYYFGFWKGLSIAIVQTGSGLDVARQGAEALIQTFRPARVASIGFASQVDLSLDKTALFMPDRLVSEDGGTLDLSRRALASEKTPDEGTSRSDVAASDSPDEDDSVPKDVSSDADMEPEETPEDVADESEAESAPSEKETRSSISLVAELTGCFRTGTLLSLNSLRPNAEQKKGVSAYDHSTWAVADVCASSGVPFLPLRIIYDLQLQNVSREATRVVKSNQSFARSMGALFGATMKKPSSVLDVCKVKREELEAADKLANAVCRILAAVAVPEKR